MQRIIHSACVNCYVFANCSQTPASTSNMSTSSESQWNVDSSDVLCVRKYQLFTHESNTFLLQNMPLKPLGHWGQTTLKSTLPLEACGPHLIHKCLGWPHSPPQRTSGSNQLFCHNTLCGQTDRSLQLHHHLCLERIKKKGKWPCSICENGIGSNFILFPSHKKWFRKQCSGVKGSLSSPPLSANVVQRVLWLQERSTSNHCWLTFDNTCGNSRAVAKCS